MNSEWRLLVGAGDGDHLPNLVSADGAVCIQILDREWVLYEAPLDSVLDFLTVIRARLPEAVSHISLQVRHVTEWTAV